MVMAMFLAAQALTVESEARNFPSYNKEANSQSIDNFTLRYGQSTVEVRVNGDNWKVRRSDILSWVDDACRSIVLYYGRLPLKRIVITVNQTNDRGVGFATATYSERIEAGSIKVNLGRHTHPADLKNTWTLTHEMVHLTFPLVHKKYNWLAEGIATYVEPIGRMRAGLVSQEQVWEDLMDGLPNGQPQSGDQGLNNTHTWGRTYWGGALYCLVADVELRKETGNKYGLENALRGIMLSGGTAQSDILEAGPILELGDRSTKTTALTRLYNQMKDRPLTINLPQLFRQLGVYRVNGKVRFNETAPLAYIRKSIESSYLK